MKLNGGDRDIRNDWYGKTYFLSSVNLADITVITPYGNTEETEILKNVINFLQNFASAVSNVEYVMLGSGTQSHEQMEALFKAITKEESLLKGLDISTCMTHNIEAALMGAAVNSLEEFTVANTLVTYDQIIAMLNLIAIWSAN